MADLPEHVARNRSYWGERAGRDVEEGRRRPSIGPPLPCKEVWRARKVG